jgi:prevent-host-death family protein
MKRVTLSKARESFSETINQVAYGQERVVLDRHGKGIAALIPIDDLTLLEELEERLDLDAFRAAKKAWERDGKKSFPLDAVVRELRIKA